MVGFTRENRGGSEVEKEVAVVVFTRDNRGRSAQHAGGIYSQANLLRGKLNSPLRGPVAGLLCVVGEKEGRGIPLSSRT